jgi:hypothetical protein
MSFGIFEAAISSEQEVGLARQAAADTFNAAVYDVRDKLGPALFTASSLEEFRDRVAMMKTDQSLYKIIGAHLHPGASVVRRIAGRGGVLEKEFKGKLADSKVANPFSRHKDPHDPKSKNYDPSGHMNPDPNHEEGSKGPQGEDMFDGEDHGPWLDSVLSDMRPEASRRHAAEDTVDIKGQFSPSEGELEPEGNFKGYLKDINQGTPAKVDNNCFEDGTATHEHSMDPAKELFAAKTAFNVYRDWCTSNQLSPMRLSSLDAYATHLPDTHYLRLAGIIQAWDNEHKPKTPKGQSKSKLRDVTAAEDNPFKNNPEFDNMVRGIAHDSPGLNPHHPQHERDRELAEAWGRDDRWPPREHEAALRRYIAWCDKNGLKRISARNVNHYAGHDPELCMHLAKRMKNAIYAARQRQAVHNPEWGYDPEDYRTYAHPLTPEQRANIDEQRRGKSFNQESPNHYGGRRTAAPDYLQKADDALTQLLNQKAQEFQDTIAPLQQALVTVQQAEQLQQSQNPMNVLPPPGTVNVMPGGDQGPAGLPAPGAQDLGAAVQALAGGAGDQVPPAGGPPPAAGGPGAAGAPAAGGGGDQGGPPPAAQDPSQLTAGRHAAMPPDYDTGNGQYPPDEDDPYQDEHQHDDYYKDTGDMFYGPGKEGPKWSRDFANQKHAVYGDSADMYDEFSPEPSYDATPHPEDPHDDFHTFEDDWGGDDPNAGGHHVVHGPPVEFGSPKKGRGASRPHTGATVHDLWTQWQQRNGGMGGQPDYDRFAQDMHVGPQAIKQLQQAHGFGGMA